MTTQHKHKPGEIPEIIYLQWYGDEDPEFLSEPEKARIDPQDGNVSWCWEQIFPGDIRYVRKDKYDQLVALNAELRETAFENDQCQESQSHKIGMLEAKNAELVEAARELVSIVKIHSKATDNNFAWAELQMMEEAIAKAGAQ